MQKQVYIKMKDKWQRPKTDFKVPEGYFEDFDARLMDALQLDQKLSEPSGFKVPQDYFTEVESKLLTKRKKGRVIPFQSTQFLAAVFAAAAIAVLVLLVLRPNNTMTDFDTISTISMEEYLLQEGVQELLTVEELALIDAGKAYFDEASITDEDMLDYMVDHNVQLDVAQK